MSSAPVRRGLFAVCLFAAVALVCLLLGHRWLQRYLETSQARAASGVKVPDSAGVAGAVTFADGTAAPSARIRVTWNDSAGRPGSTPALAGPDGQFTVPAVPSHAAVTEVRASVGPLERRYVPPDSPSGGSVGVRARLLLPREFALAGRVRRAGDRDPVAGAALEIAGVRAASDERGGFRVEKIPASALREERCVLRITAAGFAPLDWPVPKDDLPETYGDLTILMEPAK